MVTKMNYLKTQNLPDRPVRGVIIDSKISPESIETLTRMGITVFFSCKITSLNDSICTHPDMMIHHLGGNKFITAPEAYDFFSKNLTGANIIKGTQFLKEKYPKDIAYNVAAFGDFVICNVPHTAPEILFEYQATNKKILNTKQGYSKCSICIISYDAIITADSGIYNIAYNNGIDVLKISEGNILLPGMSYGFIGGATGMLDKNLLAVNGNIKKHPDFAMINNFCKNHGVDIISLNQNEIVDIGSIIPIF